MKRDYTRFDKFLTDRENDIGPVTWMYQFTEIDSSNSPHDIAGMHAITTLKNGFNIGPGSKVLDIGCGDGRFSVEMSKLGWDVTGTSLNICIDPNLQKRMKDHNIHLEACDQSFMPFEDETFDAIYARHILEHTISPFFTVAEYNRILKPNGMAYIELPMPGMSTNHEGNPNHYSILGDLMWRRLFERAGFNAPLIQDFALEGHTSTREIPPKFPIDLWKMYFLQKVSKEIT